MEATITKPALSVVDENLERFEPFKYHLIIYLSQQGASYAIIDQKQENYAAIEQLNFMNNPSISDGFELFRNYFNASQFSKIIYKSVSVVLASENYTIVPQALFDAGTAENILRFNTGINFNFEVSYQFLNAVESYLIYAIPSALKQSLINQFKDIKVLQHAHPLISESMVRFKNNQEKTFMAHIQNSQFDLMVISDHKMIFFNTFKFVSTEDVVYYTLLVCETLKLNPEEITLKLCGEIEKKSAIYALLYKYIRNIEFLNSHRNFKYSGGYSPLPSHFFFNLINSVNCVS